MKQQKITPFLMALVCAAALVTFGEALAYDHTLTKDAGLKTDFIAQAWNPEVEDEEDITTKTFLVPGGKKWQTKYQSPDITAKSVTIGEVGAASGVEYDAYYGVTYTKLILANGYLRNNATDVTLGGEVEVVSPASNPFIVRSDGYRAVGYVFPGKVTSAEGAGLLVFPTTTRGAYTGYCVKFTGDTSQYLGSIVVTSRYDSAGQPLGVRLEFSNTAFGGSITMKADAQLKADKAMTIKSLTMEASSTLAEVAGSCVTVDSVSVDGPIKLAVSGVGTPSAVISYDVLTMPVDADVETDDFVLTYTSLLTAGKLSLVTNDLKTAKTLRVTYYPTVTLKQETESPYPTATSPSASAITNGSYWSDGEPVHKEANYVASKVSGTTYFASSYSEAEDELTFPGTTLTVGDTVFFDLQAYKYYVPKMQFTGTSGFRSTAAKERTLRSDLFWISSGTLRAIGRSGSTLTLEGPFTGGENTLINLYTSMGSTSDCRSMYMLKGDNSGYLGKIRLGSAEKASGSMAPDDYRVCVLRLLAANNLGGARSVFTYNALSNGMKSTLQAEADVTLDTANRGIYVYGRSQFNVLEGKTLDIREQLTLSTNGTYSILKKGAGTLALGGNLRWLLGDAPGETRPSDVTTNRLEVSAGGIRATAARAMDGLDIVFTSDAATISVDASATDSDLKTYGFINLKTSAPLVTSAKTGAVPVTLENMPENPMAAFSVPVCTVRATAAAGVLAALTTTRKVLLGDSKCRVALAASDPFELDGQQAVTIKADVTPPVGAILLIR